MVVTPHLRYDGYKSKTSSEREYKPSEILSQENQGSFYRSVSVFLFSEFGRFVYPPPLMITSQLPLSLGGEENKARLQETFQGLVVEKI